MNAWTSLRVQPEARNPTAVVGSLIDASARARYREGLIFTCRPLILSIIVSWSTV
jgi:hypothetical protein